MLILIPPTIGTLSFDMKDEERAELLENARKATEDRVDMLLRCKPFRGGSLAVPKPSESEGAVSQGSTG